MKGETRSKILGLLVFVILISWILYLSFSSERNEPGGKIKSISVTGNNLLNENDYLSFARLNNGGLQNITLPVIKSRLEKHPYIKRADVEFSGDNQVHIKLNEKNIKAVLAGSNRLFLATDEFEILSFITDTKISDVPVVTNLSNDILIKNNEILKTPGLVDAFKIIDAEDLTNEE
ncbi:MAG TPA: FtsQ-type POTRA domain-containing protein, partial [Ignavibacteriaceae bacterium]|nr:FtsQ-type POTRA domain-containing protein [Ignavibacteriaceae bacterium]